MVKLCFGGGFERVDLASLRIHAGHDVLHNSIFAGRIQSLQDDQHRPIALGIKLVLQVGEMIGALLQQLFSVLFGAKMAGVLGIEILQPEFVAVSNAVRLG